MSALIIATVEAMRAHPVTTLAVGVVLGNVLGLAAKTSYLWVAGDGRGKWRR